MDSYRLFARTSRIILFERVTILSIFKIGNVYVGSALVLHVRFVPEPGRRCVVNTITWVWSRQSGLIVNL